MNNQTRIMNNQTRIMNNQTNDSTTTKLQEISSNPSQTSETRGERRTVIPRVDVFEDATGITVLADLPGVPREQLELNVEGDALQIEGAVSQAMPEGLEATYAELRAPRYRRSFTLGQDLDPSRIEANLKDGVLNLRIPKHAHAQPRRIEVRAA